LLKIRTPPKIPRSSEHRGIKFNIPLDLRTPSYSDCSDAAQQNIPEMWSLDFWREFLDQLARDRFNVLTLWSLHPFPSLVKVPEYPDVALDDIWRTTLKLDDTFDHSGKDMLRPQMLEHHEVLKRMTIDQKIKFWQEVMRHAHNRGIEVYIFTWNIFTFGATGKHGITPDQNNPITIDYFRKSVRELVLTYPNLAGIGITAGEQMQNRNDEFSKEKWLWKTYGEGVADAKKIQPDRQFRLIHRYHQTAQSEIEREFAAYPGQLDLSFKYAIAHMYSSPKPPFINDALPHLSPKLRTWLTIRNDDIYSFRWADPQFAREFIQNIPSSEKIAGYYMGPDGFTWGRDFLSADPDSAHELVIKKHWLSFMLWGRLSFDPNLPDSLFTKTLADHFPNTPPDKLLASWSSASKIFPEITRFFWGDIDLRWFPEACLSHPKHKGFYTVKDFIEGATMPGGGDMNITQWRSHHIADGPFLLTTPPQVAAALHQHAQTALANLPELKKSAAGDKELNQTLADIEAFAALGDYYSEKISAACELALFDLSGNEPQKNLAKKHLESALIHWKNYAQIATRQYKPALYNRVGFVDLNKLTANVENDISIAEKWQPGTIKTITGSNKGDTPFKP
jgi:hypothetical protein